MNITAEEVVENYYAFDEWATSMPTDDSGTSVAAVCADLGIDDQISVEMFSKLNMNVVHSILFFHGFTYAIWLMREKKGL